LLLLLFFFLCVFVGFGEDRRTILARLRRGGRGGEREGKGKSTIACAFVGEKSALGKGGGKEKSLMTIGGIKDLFSVSSHLRWRKGRGGGKRGKNRASRYRRKKKEGEGHDANVLAHKKKGGRQSGKVSMLLARGGEKKAVTRLPEKRREKNAPTTESSPSGPEKRRNSS